MAPERLAADARACHAAALAAVEPGALVTAALARPATQAALAGPVRLLAAGKAARPMACAALGALGTRVGEALVVVPDGTPGDVPAGVRAIGAGHPVPNAGSLEAGAAALALAESAGPGVRLLVLLSGGASALLAAPTPPLTLADKQEATRLLLAAGADIAALNTVRKHCSRLKGGGLARAAARAAGVVALVLSDVLGDDLATIGSGPTVADPTTFADALAVLDRSGVRAAAPAALVQHLEAGARGHVAETLAPADPLLARVTTEVIAGNPTAVAAAARTATALGYVTTVLPPLTGDAAAAGRLVAERLGALPCDRPQALVAGAEPTVRVVPGGVGGRAQHLALAAALVLVGQPAVVLAAGTDGVDGPTDAAGALVDGSLAERARCAGFDPAAALAATDSHPLLGALGALVRTGPTGTNVADVVVALRDAC